MYKKLYLYLFNCVIDCIEMLEDGDIILASDTLKAAQLKCEEEFMEYSEETKTY